MRRISTFHALKGIVALVLLMVGTLSASAQAYYINVYQKDGSTVRYLVADVDSVRFTFEKAPIEGVEYVDLGLSVMWATFNVGANSPEGYGDYFAWGAIDTTSTYTMEKYRFFTGYSDDDKAQVSKYISPSNLGPYGKVDNKTVLDAEDDAASANWAGEWRMPTYNEFKELQEKCSWSWTNVNGVQGYVITSNVEGYWGRSIFLPAAGMFLDELTCVNTYGRYWSSALFQSDPLGAWSLSFTRLGFDMIGYTRSNGFSIRPVRKSEAWRGITYISMPDDAVNLVTGGSKELKIFAFSGGEDYSFMAKYTWTSDNNNVATVSNGIVTGVSQGTAIITATCNGQTASCKVTVKDYVPVYDHVNLGLSVEWATCNVGAMSPTESGKYFSWGETEAKSTYTWSNYRFLDSSNRSLYSKYNFFSELGTVDYKYRLDMEDDAARVALGENWRMPTVEEYQELVNNCVWEWTDINGTQGYTVTGPNGNSIFLPAGGYRWDEETGTYENLTSYLSSSLSANTDKCAMGLDFYPHGYEVTVESREFGELIRPVYSSATPANVLNVIGLRFDENPIELVLGDSRNLNVTVIGDSSKFNIRPKFKFADAESENSNVVELTDGTITAVGLGTCSIMAYLGNRTAVLTVTVIDPSSVKPEPVDLGLSVKWATFNVGAWDPQMAGDYYSWGAVEPDDYAFYLGYENGYMQFSKYVSNEVYGEVDNKTVLDPEDDVAHVLWGGDWRMPTLAEFEELVNNCFWEMIENEDGLLGYKVTSLIKGYTDNSIFLPVGEDGDGMYWTSSVSERTSHYAYLFYFFDTDYFCGSYYRIAESAVRPVLPFTASDIRGISFNNDELSLALNSVYQFELLLLGDNGKVLPIDSLPDVKWSSSDENVVTVSDGSVKAVGEGTCTVTAVCGDYSAKCVITVSDPSQAVAREVDLGLSVKWASFNVGSFKPEMPGDYYAWGETETYYEEGYSQMEEPVWKDGKSEGYSWSSYFDTSDGGKTFNKYPNNQNGGNAVLDAADDVAASKWGGTWRMPTKAEFEELLNVCSWTWTTLNGVNGYIVKSNVPGYEADSIFLPVAGYRYGNNLYNDNTYGNYWTSTLAYSSPMEVELDENYHSVYAWSRNVGLIVRPVCNSDSWAGITYVELKDSIVIAADDDVTAISSILSGKEDYSFYPGSWKSSNEAVATVDETGIVHGVSEGVATITADYDGLTSSCTVVVAKLSIVDPSRADALYTNMYTMLGQPLISFPSKGRPDDFGFISASISTDFEAADMIMDNSGYSWFSVCGDLTSRTGSYSNPYMRYNICYDVIGVANKVLNAYDADNADPAIRAKRAEAHAMRAFAYLNLAPYYQFSYTSSDAAKEAPCVPIVTENTVDLSNNPRASVQEVYDLILSDLNIAINDLDGWIRPDKSTIDQQVAYGLRARAYLNMGRWAEAAADAERAMAGYSPASIKDVSKPFLYDISESNWMWGYDMTDSISSIFRFATSSSWLRSFSGNAYVPSSGLYVYINSLLYDMIPSTDVRKGWWVDEDLYSPLLEGLTWGDLEGQDIALGWNEDKEQFLPYTNVKFGVKELGTEINDEDWCWMRAEEMILIMAEGYAKSGNEAQARRILTDFVRTYRDPSYDIDARGLTLDNEIWFQRRVELWGEGFSNNDTRRLNKPLVRFHSYMENNYPDDFRFNMRADDGWWLMRFPDANMNSNAALINNTDGELPEFEQEGYLLDGVTDWYYKPNDSIYYPVDTVYQPIDTVVPVKRLFLAEDSIIMVPGNSAWLALMDENGKYCSSYAVWSSSNDSVVYVENDGTIHAIAPGHAVITAQYNGLTAVCTVLVISVGPEDPVINPQDSDSVFVPKPEFIIADDSVSCQIIRYDILYDQKITATFVKSDSGGVTNVKCTAMDVVLVFKDAKEASKAYDAMPQDEKEQMGAVLDGNVISYSYPPMIGLNWDYVIDFMHDIYEGMLEDPSQTEDVDPIEMTLSDFVPTGYKGSYSYVDLGLSVNWASLNVGADSLTSYGDYFTWGETETYYVAGYAQAAEPVWKNGKSGYDYYVNKYYEGNNYEEQPGWTKYCFDSEYGKDGFTDRKTVLESSDDAASVNWGESWRTPTFDEIKELQENCTWTWIKVNGVVGYRVMSKVKGYEGRYIFIPASGMRFKDGLEYLGVRGCYWSSELEEEGHQGKREPFRANYLHMDSKFFSYGSCARYYALTVRPVCSKN